MAKVPTRAPRPADAHRGAADRAEHPVAKRAVAARSRTHDAPDAPDAPRPASAASESPDHGGLLSRFRGEIAREIGPEAYARYFDGQIAMRLGGGRLSIAAPTRFLASMIERRFGDVLRGAIASIPGMSGCSVEVAAPDERPARAGAGSDAPESAALLAARKRGPDESGPTDRHARDRAPRSAPRDGAAAPGLQRAADTRTQLSDRYRLEDFIVGESNRLAYDTAVRLAESEPLDTPDEHPSLPAMPRRARPLRSFGPLFLHGQCGIGKTHLLQGIALRFKQRRPGAIVRFITGEAFTNEFLAALHGSEHTPAGGGGQAPKSASAFGSRAGGSSASHAAAGKTSRDSMDRFRKRHRRVDLLCIDDVHFLANKSATQAELLHTFNELELSGAHIILACDEHPRHVKKFSDALISRFMSGMVARIDPPDRDLCEKIIRRFAERRGLVFDQAALRALSANVAAVGEASGPRWNESGASRGMSIREIEGLVTRIEAFLRLSAENRSDGPLQVTTGTIRQVMSGAAGRAVATLPQPLGGGRSNAGRRAEFEAGDPAVSEHAAASFAGSGKPIRLDSIMIETCRLLGVEHSDLTGNGRHPRVVLARSIIGHLARRLTRLSFPEIARGMGRPSHSTIIAACQRLEKQLVPADGPAPLVPGLDLTVAEVCDRLASALGSRAG